VRPSQGPAFDKVSRLFASSKLEKKGPTVEASHEYGLPREFAVYKQRAPMRGWKKAKDHDRE
jgi:hypothetical protein